MEMPHYFLILRSAGGASVAQPLLAVWRVASGRTVAAQARVSRLLHHSQQPEEGRRHGSS
jgi:hypothetical protein